MNYQEAVEYIERIPRFIIAEPLVHTKEMLKRVGNPQDSLKVIHVAGTNGKGSVCAYLDSMFREGGFKCGLFTSPHLVKVNERIRINGEEISDDTFLQIFTTVKKVIDNLVNEGYEHPSYFELVCVMGMLYFKEQKVNIVILETGLGGRLDATNVIDKPLACVITSIGLDHTEYLGDTIPKIAREKAGIIKSGVPVIFTKTSTEATNAIVAQAKELNAPIYECDNSLCEMIQKTPEGIDFSFGCKYYRNDTFFITSIASYQMENAALAILTMGILQNFHKFSRGICRRGIAKTNWEGRMETVLPKVILDGSHNEDGIIKFAETAAEFSKQYKITVLFTTVSDKNYVEMIKLIIKKIKPSAVVTTQIDGERLVRADKLAARFRAEGCASVYSNADVSTAFWQAFKLKGDGLLFCVGSLYMVGEIKSKVLKEEYK